MFDTHDVTRTLTDADFTPTQAAGIARAIRLAVAQRDHITAAEFRAGTAEMRAEARAASSAVHRKLLGHMSEQYCDLKNSDITWAAWTLGIAGMGLLFVLILVILSMLAP